jgi:methylmalonyl-CoA mutase
MNQFTEIAKMRAARLLWSKIVKSFNPSNPKSLALRTHCQTSGWSLTEQDPYNNVSRTCVEALSAIFGGTQSLHTNSLDEAIALPSEHAAKIARNTQLFIQHETNITKTIDPWGGSIYVEKLTKDIAEKAWKLIEEVEELGGMTKAIESGLPKMRIEEAAAKRQAKIDSGREIIVGVNAYQSNNEEDIDVLDIDNEKVRIEQITRLEEIKASRNNNAVNKSLEEISNCARTGNGNILSLAIEAAKNRATLGEISMALEKEFGRYQATIRTISGVYSSELMNDDNYNKALNLAKEFEEIAGRRPRIMVAKMGQDGHDRGAKIVATSFADIGFDVDIGPLFQTPKEAARQAADSDVHILGISSLAAGHKTLVPEVINALKEIEREDIMIIVGGVVPKKDYEFLFKLGVAAVFGPGTNISIAAQEIIQTMLKGMQ